MGSSELFILVVGLFATVVMVPFYDRLRQMNWRTHRCDVVAFHLFFALWLGFVAWSALVEGLPARPHDVLAVAAGAAWIALSRSTWKGGTAPAHTERNVDVGSKVLR